MNARFLVRQLMRLALLAAVCAVAVGIVTAGWPARSEVSPNVVADSLAELTEEVSLPFKMAALSMNAPDERLAMPVEGSRVSRVADTWGAPRAGGRGHAGQDIFAKRGTPVYSATEGYVLRIGETPVGGNTVFVLGAGGRHYYYAHLDAHAEKLAAGDYVTTDTLIGYVGTTGNATGTPPHLHFGIYTAAGAINPLPLLTDRS